MLSTIYFNCLTRRLVKVEHHQLNYINHEHTVVTDDMDERRLNNNPLEIIKLKLY